jgi:hypothetical protein
VKRTSTTLFARNEQDGYAVGDAAAHRAAAALADKADAPTIQAVTQMLDFFTLVGGQCHAVTAREKFDRYENRVGDDEDGEWATTGIVFKYETRDLRVIEAKAPEEILGLPVSDSNGPPVVVEGARPEGLDEIEMELAAVEEGVVEDEVEEPVALTE